LSLRVETVKAPVRSPMLSIGRMKMKKAVTRLVLVGVLQILLFELLTQISVHWRESTQEMLSMPLFILMLAGIVWGSLPAFSKLNKKAVRIVCRVALVAVLFIGLYTVDYFYYWHIRPNVGLYREPDWVAQHPGFQSQLRARIEANKWGSPGKPDANDAQ
jgi:hypothetical protein